MGLKMFDLRKILFLAALAVTMSVLSVTSAFAVNPCVPRPGCSCNFYEAAERHADAIRVRDKAYHRQTVKQNDNTMGMNCYDKALLLSSRSGQIFSDTTPGNIWAPANFKAFDPQNILGPDHVYDPGAGVGNNPRTNKSKLVSSNYELVFDQEAKNHVRPQNFGDTLSFWLGATIFNFLSGFLAGINGVLTNILNTINQIATEFNNIMNLINNIQNWLDIIGGALPAIVQATVAFIQNAWNVLYPAIVGIIQGFQNTLNNFVSWVAGQIQGLIGSLLEFAGTPGQDPCARIKRLWNPASISGQILGALGVPGFRPMEGGGIEQGAPYFDFQALVSGALNDPLGAAINVAAALDLTDELNNITNQPILTAALNDLTTGILSARQAPAAGVIWPTIPATSLDPNWFTPPQDVITILGAGPGSLQRIINDM